jgi:monoamine oxidase
MTTSPLKMTKKILIIGSGFSSISAATYLADKGYDVTVFEKNSSFGGRARKFETNGFTFDMGPSWYWMPDVFEKYFNDFDKSVSDFYNLKKTLHLVEGLENLKLMDSLLIWDRHGIGCLMFLRNILMTLVNLLVTSIT